jgi:hypothetical protein
MNLFRVENRKITIFCYSLLHLIQAACVKLQNYSEIAKMCQAICEYLLTKGNLNLILHDLAAILSSEQIRGGALDLPISILFIKSMVL